MKKPARIAFWAILAAVSLLRRPRATPASAAHPALMPDDFKNLFLLLVSLLQGSIFLELTRLTLVAFGSDRGQAFWAGAFFNYALFFRIIQSQLAAAMKYSHHWRVGPFDFIVVFITAFFEYVLFTHEGLPWSSMDSRRVLILLFAGFGIASYALTYARTRLELPARVRRVERQIQLTNVGVLAGIALACLLWKYAPTALPEVAFNLLSGSALLANIYVSVALSRRAALLARAG